MPRQPPVVIALRRLERLLPGRPSPDRTESDPRWQAMLRIQDEFVVSHPEELWPFILRWGKHPQIDLRDAIACCLLEHLLEHHFALFFPRVSEAARRSPRFTDTLRRCSWLGQAARTRHARELDELVGKTRPRLRVPAE